jgi:hypothetical protein
MALFNLSKSYNFSEVVLTIDGQRIGGYGEDGGVSVEFAGDDSEMVQGADGEVVVNQLPRQPATMTVTLLETSLSNGILQAIYTAQRLTGTALSPLALVDPSTGESLMSAEAKIANRPNITKNKSASAREWKILLPYPEVLYPVL